MYEIPKGCGRGRGRTVGFAEAVEVREMPLEPGLAGGQPTQILVMVEIVLDEQLREEWCSISNVPPALHLAQCMSRAQRTCKPKRYVFKRGSGQNLRRSRKRAFASWEEFRTSSRYFADTRPEVRKEPWTYGLCKPPAIVQLQELFRCSDEAAEKS